MSARGLFLQWEGKRVYRQRVPTPRLLEPVAELSVGVASSNMVIEGDNLQVLASLKSRYAGQVDVIYIDPPYNLGTNDFRYSDKRFHDPDADDNDAVYVKNEDGGRHTKWLNFMAPRLYMLREMLHDANGVIFVSINDVELFRLGMLLNEIFGEDNRVGTIVWKGATDNNPTRIAVEHEYILCYAKHKDRLPAIWSGKQNEAKALMLEAFHRIKRESTTFEELQRKFSAFAKDNQDLLGDLYRYRKVDDNGPFASRRNLDNPGKPGNMDDIPHPKTKKPVRKPVWGWRYSTARLRELQLNGRIIFGKDDSQIPQLKVYLEEVEFPLRSVVHLDARAGSNDLDELFGARDVFKNPKPVALMEMLLGYSTRPDSLVLDAFAGSGTTAQALLNLNHRDGGNRRFIMIEEGRPGDQFARSLTAERIKRAITKYGYSYGFTFFKTGRKLDRLAIVSLERDALAALICQADETGRGRGITRLTGYRYIIGKNDRNEAICLVWADQNDNEVTKEDYRKAALEVRAAGLRKPFRMYGGFTYVGDTSSWQFCQIPDEIMAQMHILEDLEPDEVEAAG